MDVSEPGLDLESAMDGADSEPWVWFRLLFFVCEYGVVLCYRYR